GRNLQVISFSMRLSGAVSWTKPSSVCIDIPERLEAASTFGAKLLRKRNASHAVREPQNTGKTMSSYETVLIDKSDRVATLILNRPAKKNAMSPQLHADVTAALEELRYDDDTKVVVITGAGDAFCAGMDLKEFFHELKEQPARYDAVLRMA